MGFYLHPGWVFTLVPAAGMASPSRRPDGSAGRLTPSDYVALPLTTIVCITIVTATMTTRDPSHLLPLAPAAFHILVSLADTDRHGYSVMQEVSERSGGAVKLQAGTLYATLKKLLADGLIRELDARPGADQDDSRRRYYRLTPFGRDAVQAEARRLAELVRQARASGLLVSPK